MSGIDVDRLRRSIVEDGAEDYTGLYEIIWSLNKHYPATDRDTKVAAARSVLIDLLTRREVTLFTTRWASAHYEPVPADTAVELAASLEAWQDPDDAPYVCYATA